VAALLNELLIIRRERTGYRLTGKRAP